jgi:ribosomal protein S18 acetylase RimI-like enzyme
MEITPVASPKELKTFLDLSYSIYKNDPVWVPPLRSDLAGQFDHVKNPFLDHCAYALFVIWKGSKPVGRIAAFYDTLANDFWGERVGLFGYYECPADFSAAQMLLSTAVNWLKGEGMTCMRGPWSFVSQEWGSVIEGFAPSPVVMSPYNPPYYNDQYTSFGLSKVKDLVVYYIDAHEGYRIPERILTLTDKVANRYGIHVRQIEMRKLEEEVETIMSLSNASLKQNWGYSPVTDAEVRTMAHDLKPVIHPKGVIFAETNEGKPIGFAIAIPDVNVILKKIKGRMFPFGWITLLTQLPGLKSYRMFALGVIPEYQGKGIDSLLYKALYESIFSADLFLEINYVLEDNDRMNNAILKLGAKRFRKYRIFEMQI